MTASLRRVVLASITLTFATPTGSEPVRQKHEESA